MELLQSGKPLRDIQYQALDPEYYTTREETGEASDKKNSPNIDTIPAESLVLLSFRGSEKEPEAELSHNVKKG